jgi:hypothetical protein
MKCFVLFELHNSGREKPVHLYRIEIGVSAGRRRGERRERSCGRQEAKAQASLRKKRSGQAG